MCAVDLKSTPLTNSGKMTFSLVATTLFMLFLWSRNPQQLFRELSELYHFSNKKYQLWDSNPRMHVHSRTWFYPLNHSGKLTCSVAANTICEWATSRPSRPDHSLVKFPKFVLATGINTGGLFEDISPCGTDFQPSYRLAMSFLRHPRYQEVRAYIHIYPLPTYRLTMSFLRHPRS